MDKELHIWLDHRIPVRTHVDLNSTLFALKNNNIIIHTTQTHVCSTTWLVNGYRIFAHMLDGQTVEIKLGYVEGCDREIRVAHNLEKLLLANEFGLATLP